VPLWLGRRLGGHSGDSYGACVEWTDTPGPAADGPGDLSGLADLRAG